MANVFRPAASGSKRFGSSSAQRRTTPAVRGGQSPAAQAFGQPPKGPQQAASSEWPAFQHPSWGAWRPPASKPVPAGEGATLRTLQQPPTFQTQAQVQQQQIGAAGAHNQMWEQARADAPSYSSLNPFPGWEQAMTNLREPVGTAKWGLNPRAPGWSSQLREAEAKYGRPASSREYLQLPTASPPASGPAVVGGTRTAPGGVSADVYSQTVNDPAFRQWVLQQYPSGIPPAGSELHTQLIQEYQNLQQTPPPQGQQPAAEPGQPAGIQTSVEPQGVYPPEFTQSAGNLAAALSTPARYDLLRPGMRPGITSASGISQWPAGASWASAMGDAAISNPIFGSQHRLANLQQILSGMRLGDQEALGWGGLGLQGQQNQQNWGLGQLGMLGQFMSNLNKWW